MKRLILLRHGKSAWDTDAATDHARPLAARGVNAAKTMGEMLTRIGQTPDLVVSSSAVRALATARLAAEAGEWGSEIEVSDMLYLAVPQAVLMLAKEAPQDVDRLMLVGHEPTWSAVTELLTSAIVRAPTAVAIGIDLDAASWRDIGPGRGVLAYLLPPRLFTVSSD